MKTLLKNFSLLIGLLTISICLFIASCSEADFTNHDDLTAFGAEYSGLDDFVDSVNQVGLNHNSYLEALINQLDVDVSTNQDTFDHLAAQPQLDPTIDSTDMEAILDSMQSHDTTNISLSSRAQGIKSHLESNLENWIINDIVVTKCDSLILVIDTALTDGDNERIAMGIYAAVVKHSSNFWLDTPFDGLGPSWGWGQGNPGSITWKQKEVLKADGKGAFYGAIGGIGGGPSGMIIAASFWGAWHSIVRAYELALGVEIWIL